jgi:hypothetical protein
MESAGDAAAPAGLESFYVKHQLPTKRSQAKGEQPKPYAGQQEDSQDSWKDPQIMLREKESQVIEELSDPERQHP